MPAIEILWVQNDARFGRRGDDRTWPQALREILHSTAQPRPGSGGLIEADDGEGASFAYVLFARGLPDGLRILQERNIDIALIGLPVSLSNLSGANGVNPQWVLDGNSLHSDQLRRLLKQIRSACEVRFFTRSDPAESGIPEVEAADSKSLCDFVRKALDKRARNCVSNADLGDLVSVYNELEGLRGSVVGLASLLAQTGLSHGIDNGKSQTLLADLFPALALQATRGDVWRSVQREWERTRAILGAACLPHQKVLALCRLLNARDFDWSGKPKFAIDLVGEFPVRQITGSSGMSPVEFCFHMPADMKDSVITDEQFPAIWKTIRDAAVLQLDRFTAADGAFDATTLDCLKTLKNILESAKRAADIESEHVEVYESLRWYVRALKKELAAIRSVDGNLVPLNCTFAGVFASQRLSLHGNSANKACTWLARDLASNFVASRLSVTAGGVWPAEGWFAIWGDTAKNESEIEDVFATHQKDWLGLQFLGGYFEYFAFSFVGGRVVPWRVEGKGSGPSAGIMKGPGRSVQDSLEKDLARCDTPSNKVGYVMILRNFPASSRRAEARGAANG